MAMLDISTALLGALTVRLTGKIDDDVALSSGWQIEPGHLGRDDLQGSVLPDIANRSSFLARSYPTVGRTA